MASIIQISEAASLALHSMVMLAASPERSLTVKEMTARTGVSEAHLSKVMQRLAKASLVKSTRGPKGGFLLGDRGLSTALLAIFESIEGPIDAGGCLLPNKECPFRECLFGGLLGRMTSEFKEYMKNKTLGDMISCQKEE
ncbi:MAG: Rrf2 family transcriptional regulator [Negativicutes bacterium]